jgi:hypothetical protein
MNKTLNTAMINSYLRNVIGALLGAVITVVTLKDYASPLELKSEDWQAVAHVLWAGAVPTLMRFFNAKDSAFGRTAK